MLATAISDASATAFVAAVDMQQNVPQLYTFPQLFFFSFAPCALFVHVTITILLLAVCV